MLKLRTSLLLVKILPEILIMKLFMKGVNTVLSFKGAHGKEYKFLIKEIVRKELHKEDIYTIISVILSYRSKFNKMPLSKDEKIPVFVLSSENDSSQDPSNKAKFRSLYGKITFYNMGSSGHNPYLENPVYFRDVIIEVASNTKFNL